MSGYYDPVRVLGREERAARFRTESEQHEERWLIHKKRELEFNDTKIRIDGDHQNRTRRWSKS